MHNVINCYELSNYLFTYGPEVLNQGAVNLNLECHKIVLSIFFMKHIF